MSSVPLKTTGTVLGILVCFGIGALIFVFLPGAIRPYPIPGKVISADSCQMECETDAGCIYNGNIIISFTYLDKNYNQTVPVNGACIPDCCEEAIRKKKTAWLELNDLNEIINYSIPDIFSIVIFTLLGILTTLGGILLSIHLFSEIRNSRSNYQVI